MNESPLDRSETQRQQAPSLFGRRVIVVLGKGGVGRSVVSASLALLAASQGLRPCIVEMNGAETMGSLFGGGPVGYAGRELRSGIWAQSITPTLAVEEYLVRTLRVRRIYDLVFKNRYVEPFMNGVMGLSDLISVGKVMDLEWLREDGSLGPNSLGSYRFAPVIVDGPATGHALTMLRSPQAMMDVTRAGPLFRNAESIRELFCDPSKVAVLLVTLPEELPITEALEAAEVLGELGIRAAGVVVNGMPQAPLSAPSLERWPELQAEAKSAGGASAWAAGEIETRLRRRSAAEAQLRQLRQSLELPLVELPLLPNPQLSLDELGTLGHLLETWT